MSEDYPDKGNPNVFTTFKGMFDCTNIHSSIPSVKVMVTCTNDVQFIIPVFSASQIFTNTTLFVVPEICRPKENVFITVTVLPQGTSNFQVLPLVIRPTGLVSVVGSLTNTHNIYIGGLSYNISNNYYLQGE